MWDAVGLMSGMKLIREKKGLLASSLSVNLSGERVTIELMEKILIVSEDLKVNYHDFATPVLLSAFPNWCRLSVGVRVCQNY